MTLIDAGSGPTHPSGPAGPRPAEPPRPNQPSPGKATGPDGPIGAPKPEPGPTTPRADIPNPDPNIPPKPQPGPKPPNHLVDHGWRLEVWSRGSDLLAVAEVRTAGLWWMSWLGRPPVYVGGREQAEDACRELVVAS